MRFPISIVLVIILLKNLLNHSTCPSSFNRLCLYFSIRAIYRLCYALVFVLDYSYIHVSHALQQSHFGWRRKRRRKRRRKLYFRSNQERLRNHRYHRTGVPARGPIVALFHNRFWYRFQTVHIFSLRFFLNPSIMDTCILYLEIFVISWYGISLIVNTTKNPKE